MPLICKKGCCSGMPISWATCVFLCKLKQKSNSLGCFCLTNLANAMVARTSDKASCAASCVMPFAAHKCSSLKLTLPSSLSGQLMPSGRKAYVVRSMSKISQRPQLFCHSRAYGSIKLRHNIKRVISSSNRIVL